MQKEGNKTASARITIDSELETSDFIAAAIERKLAQGKRAGAKYSKGNRRAAVATATGISSAASADGVCGAAITTGLQSAASAVGVYGAAVTTGLQSAAIATGYQSAAIATGYQSAAITKSYDSAAATTGPRSLASSTGDHSVASSAGDDSKASSTGKHSAALSFGRAGRVRGAEGCALFLVFRDVKGDIKHAWAGIAGRDGIKPMTWYSLNEEGNPVECKP